MNEEEKNVRIRVEKTVFPRLNFRIYLTRTYLTIMIGLSVLYLDNPSFVQIYLRVESSAQNDLETIIFN